MLERHHSIVPLEFGLKQRIYSDEERQNEADEQKNMEIKRNFEFIEKKLTG